MNNSKFAILLSSARREKQFSVRQLAEHLRVSEQTVELWESGKQYPDLSMLPTISDALGLTPGELISGERNPKGYIPSPEEDALVNDMIAYAGKVSHYQTTGMTFAIFSIILVISLFTCFLVNFLIEQRFSWSLYPLGASVVVWTSVAPLILFKKHRALSSLIAFAVTVPGYLFLIELMSPAKNWVIPLALPILGILYAFALTIIFLYRRTRLVRHRVAAISLLIFGFPVNIALHLIVQTFLGYSLMITSSITVAAIFLLAAVVCFVLGERRSRST
jgi:transcriptional regulator with XRE-family HTH domain